MTELLLDPLIQPILIPLLAGLVCGLLPQQWSPVRSWIAVVAAAWTVIVVWPLVAAPGRFVDAGFDWFRVDALSGFIALATAGFTVVVTLYSVDYIRDSRKPASFAVSDTCASGYGLNERSGLYFTCLLWSTAFALSALLTSDFVVLVMCWGLLALTLYLLIGMSGPEASEAARKTLMIVGGSDTLLLFAVAMLWSKHGSTRMDAIEMDLTSLGDYLAFGCLAAAAFAKAGVIPLHTWLPDCGEKAHAPVTAFLPAALDKLLGVYLLARLVTDWSMITPGLQTLLMLFGAVTIVTAALLALAQQNLKRALAYCAVGQIGYILLGLGTGTALGYAAALFHMLNHAIYKSCLFLGAGVIEKKAGSVDLDQLGGLATRLPITFVTFFVAALSVAGMPPLNGFASKWMIYQALIDTGRESGGMLWILWLVSAMMGSALTLALMVKLLHAVFLCKPSPEVQAAQVSRAGWSACLAMALLATLCIVFGVFADAIPLRYLILPAVGQPVTYPGTWWASQATGLLLLAFALGWCVYALAARAGKLRHVPNFIGGERLDETRIPGVPRGPQRHVEVTGTDFYRTVQQLPVLRSLYSVARNRLLDVYELAGSCSSWLTACLRATHTGLLTVYLVWFMVGLLGLLFVMLEGSP